MRVTCAHLCSAASLFSEMGFSPPQKHHVCVRMFSWRIKRKRRTAAGLSLFKSAINHGEGEEYDRPVIHHAARTPFQMVIGLSVSPIVTAVSRRRGVATPQRGERRRAASFSDDARSDLWRQRGAGPLHLFAETAVQMKRKSVIYDGG